MKLSELIQQLEQLKAHEGDLKVIVDSLSHSWPPDPTVRDRNGEKVVVLNG